MAQRVSVTSSPLTVTVRLDADCDVYGLGAGAAGTPTRNGTSLRLMNLDTIFFGIPKSTYASFPIVWIRRPTGPCMAVVVLTARPLDVVVDADAVRFTEVVAGDSVADVVIATGSPVDVVGALASVLGRSFVPPAWALGFHQSRWSYRTAEEVIAVAEGARRADIPLDVIHLDIHMMDEYRVFSWHPRRFPAPRQLHDQLGLMGVRTMAIIDPGVSTDGPSATRDALEGADGLLKRHDGSAYAGKVWPGETVFPDFAVDGVRDIWAGAHKTLTDAGVSGFWNDMNDPVFRVGAVYDPLAEDVVHTDGSHVDKRNLYANEMAAATRQGLEAARPGERHFVLSRSGFLGIQRNAALWTGDNFSSWEQLEENLHMVIHLGLSGVPWSGADIGGFGGRRGKYGIAKLKPPAELFVRWLELGALMPFCRVHSVLYAPRQEPWSFSSTVTALSRRILRRRYRLLGVLNTLAKDAATTGAPIVRPMWWHAEVPRGHAEQAARQFFVGPDLLAAPVMQVDVRSLSVWLPEGRWLDTRTGQLHVAGAGGDDVTVDAPLGSPPLFIRAGAVVPWLVPGRNATDTLKSPLTFEVAAPQAWLSRGRLTLDDGVSASGHADIGIDVRDKDGVISIDIALDRQGFSPAQGTFRLRLPPGFSSVLDDTGSHHRAVERTLDIVGDDGRGGTVCEVELPLKSGHFSAK